MTITELEKKSGIPRSTIHFYIRNSLLHEPVRKSQTVAYYDENHLEKLEKIKKIREDFLKTAKTTRVPLEFIRDNLDDTAPSPIQATTTKTYSQKSSTKKTAKKEEIIKATLKLYMNRGYYRTNIRDITKKVGITTPTFYHYFTDKRELFAQVIDHVIDQWKEQSLAATADKTDPTERTVILFRVFQKNYIKIGGVLNQLKASAATGDTWARRRLKLAYQSLMENLVKLVESGIKSGTVRNVDPELMAYFLITIDEATVQRASMDAKYTTEHLMMFIADMIARGFLTPKGIKGLEGFRKKAQQQSGQS